MQVKEEKLYRRQLERLERREQKNLQRPEHTYWKEKTAPLRERVAGYVPEAVSQTLSLAFEKSFALVFEKGAGLVEKSAAPQKKRAACAENSAALRAGVTRNGLKRFDRQAKRGAVLNQGISLAEGAALGVLGIGLPDIPVLLGVLLKAVYEVAMSYGFDYDTPQERVFILHLLRMAALEGDARRACSAQVDRIGYAIDRGQEPEIGVGESIPLTAEALCTRLLVMKAIQGLPLVGVVGGVANLSIMHTVTRSAMTKYKKRFLQRGAKNALGR